MKSINPFVQLVAVIWLLATVACFATKNSDPIGSAAIVTLFAGFAYMIAKD